MSRIVMRDCSTTLKLYLIDGVPAVCNCGHNSAGEGGIGFCRRLFRHRSILTPFSP